MVTKAFSIEDGNLATRSILVARKRDYKDIDLSFTNKTTGEIYKKQMRHLSNRPLKIYCLPIERKSHFNLIMVVN